MIKKFRYALEALLLIILLGISKILPVDWASALGGFLGRAIGPRLAASRKAMTNINIALPDKNDAEVQEIITGMWENLGRVMMEYPHLRKIAKERTEIIGADKIKNIKNQPAILIAAHLGNWECCPPTLHTKLDGVFTPIYRAPNNPVSDWLLNKMRSLNGEIKTIPKSRTGTRNIVKAMQENNFIGLLIDQKYNEGEAVNFFGRPAMTSPIFAQLAQKFDCPLIPLRIERLKGCNFRITAGEAMDTRDKMPVEIIEEAHRLFENWIEERPEQWLWLHRRWGKINDTI
jgi:KDO2-lipid IV(A) lauroyltransferase